MKKLLYISPSSFPSQAANSTHVLLQTEALSKIYSEVRVIGLSSTNEKISKIYNRLQKHYSIDLKKIQFSLCKSLGGYAETLTIAIFSIWFVLSLRDHQIITRNLYAAFFIIFLRNDRFIYETHTVETGFRKYIQKFIIKSSKVKVVVISKSLKKLLLRRYQVDQDNFYILHDAARSGLSTKLNKNDIPPELLSKYEYKIGYFGSLLPGRGIDIIEEIAKIFPSSLFLIYGPKNQNTEFENRAIKPGSNIYFGGFLRHAEIHNTMLACDILLMPYQEKVFIDMKGTDTSKWMSPMKMFEYMATGKPIISSDLPVLREVLKDGENAILTNPSEVLSWKESILKVINNPSMASLIGKNAREKYIQKYNWDERAKKLSHILSAKKTNQFRK